MALVPQFKWEKVSISLFFCTQPIFLVFESPLPWGEGNVSSAAYTVPWGHSFRGTTALGVSAGVGFGGDPSNSEYRFCHT